MRADGVTTEAREAEVQPLNKERVAHCFRQAIATYDLHATVQQRIGERLLNLAGRHPAISSEQVLEIGCCTGILTEMLCRQHRISTLFLNDLVSDFAKIVKARIPEDRMPEICPLFGDIEALPLPHDLDLIVSSSTFQWLSDLPAFLPRLVPALRDRGFLVFSIFGPGTLMEFTELTGVGLSYRSPEQIAELLDPHFILEHQQTVQDQLFLPSPRDVLHHLRDTGVGGVRTHRWTSSTLKLFEQQYKAHFGTPEGVPVSYTSTCYIARKK